MEGDRKVATRLPKGAVGIHAFCDITKEQFYNCVF